VSELVFQYVTNRLARKNVSEMTYVLSRGTQNLNSSLFEYCTSVIAQKYPVI